MAGMYAVYHGPEGLREIGLRVHGLAKMLGEGLQAAGHSLVHKDFFDTVRVKPKAGAQEAILESAAAHCMNFRKFEDGSFGISLDEVSNAGEVDLLLDVFAPGRASGPDGRNTDGVKDQAYGGSLKRKSDYLRHPVFNSHHSETEMLRYIHELESKDLSLTTSMIPLGSCTMKLNATTEMIPVTWTEFGRMHPYAPEEQAAGYALIFKQLGEWLGDIAGLPAISLMPNAGAQGEYAGLLVIRAYHESRGDKHRRVCLIPTSAHGTNPASAVMAGMEIVLVRCDGNGNIEVADLTAKAEQHRDNLAALMVTYPSTHGVFEEAIKEICAIVHHQRRAGLHGRREHERAGRPLPPRRDRRGRLSPQSSQDLLYPPRRRRPGDGANRSSQAPCAVPPQPPGSSCRRTPSHRPCLSRAVGKCEHPPDLLGIHRNDGK